MTSSTYERHSLYQLMACLLTQEKYDELDAKAQSYCGQDGLGKIHYFQALADLKRHRYQEALEHIKKALEMGCSDPKVHKLATKLFMYYIQDRANQNEGDLEDVVSQAEKFLNINRQSEPGQFKNLLPFYYLRTGRTQDAARLWHNEFISDPENDQAVHNLAISFYWQAMDCESRHLENVDPSGTEKIDALWQNAIAYWVMLLHMDHFWEDWIVGREKVCFDRLDRSKIEKIKRNLLEDRFYRKLHHFIDHYSKEGREADVKRHENYLTILSREEKICKNFKVWIYDQRAKIKKTAKGNFEKLIHLTPRGFVLLEQQYLVHDLIYWVDQQFSTDKDRLKLAKFRMYLSPYGHLYTMIEDRKKCDLALKDIEQLSSGQKNSVEAKFLRVLISIRQNQFVRPLGSEIMPILNVLGDVKSKFDSLISNKMDDFLLALAKASVAELNDIVEKIFNQGTKTYKTDDERQKAVTVLKKAVVITKSKNLKLRLALLYCDIGVSLSKDKKFSEGQKYFKEALSLDSDNLRAKQEMATSFNNQGVALGNSSRAIKCYENALKYNDTLTIRENYAGACNGCAINLTTNINSNTSSSTLDEPIRLYKLGLRTLNPKLDYDLENFRYMEEWQFDNAVKTLPDDLYKTMMKNIWQVYSWQKILRQNAGYY